MPRIHVLFVCSQNKWRSPTAETIYRDDQRMSVRSRGTARTAVRTIQAADLAWADLVMVMEHKHRTRLLADYPGETKYLPMHVLEIPDEYRLMDEELIELIKAGVEPLIDEFLARPSSSKDEQTVRGQNKRG